MFLSLVYHNQERQLPAGQPILLRILIVFAIRQSTLGNITGCMFLVMFATIILFFEHRSGFALFKLAMYCQPFLIATMSILVALALRQYRMRLRIIAPLTFTAAALFVYANAITQRYYIKQSMTMNLQDSSFLQVRNASSLDLASILSPIGSQSPGVLIADTENPSLGKLAGIYAHNDDLMYPSWNFLVSEQDISNARYNPIIPTLAIKMGLRMEHMRSSRFKGFSYHISQSKQNMFSLYEAPSDAMTLRVNVT